MVKLSEKARDWLANHGYDPAFGVRPLRRALQKFVESPLSIRLLSGEYRKGDVIEVDIEGGEDTELDKQVVFHKASSLGSSEGKPRRSKSEKADADKKEVESKESATTEENKTEAVDSISD